MSMIGRRLAHFQIEEKLGSGGMGVVYRAKDTKLDRDVAIKVLRDELASDPDRLRRFEQEARAASALDHPNIITIHDIAESEGIRYIVMQYAEGQTFRELLTDGPLSTEKILRLSTQIAEGLAKAHAAGIIHRDLKPENLMVTGDGYVKILDFGLAKLLPEQEADSEAATITKEGTVAGAVLGTASYMSPEQALGKPLDTRTDVFSLGTVLYEMATGKKPFQGETAVALFDELLHTAPPPPTSLNPQLPKEIDTIVQKALEKDPRDRYKSAKELLAAIHAVSQNQFTPGPPTQKSIVVLPFENMSPDPEQEYFCDGMAEEIINALTHVKNLRVVARTSAFSFKRKQIDIREIGNKLGVETVLEGSVRRSGNRLRITAQLINVADGYHLWSERFDREMRDVFDIQDEISLAIVENLKVQLLQDEEQALVKRHTDDIELYQLYLKGRYHWSRFDEKNIKKSRECFEKALEIDPRYSPALAGLSVIYLISGGTPMTLLPPNVAYSKATKSAETAIEIDPGNGEALGILGWLQGWYAWDWKSAEETHKRAIEVDPNNAIAHGPYSWFLSVKGKPDEAIRERQRAIDLDPLSPHHYGEAALQCYLARRYSQALEYCERCLELLPDFSYVHLVRGVVYIQERAHENALAALVSKPLPWGDGILGYCYAKNGNPAEARKVLHELEQKSKDEAVETDIALVHLGLGDIDSALNNLEAASNEAPAVMQRIGVVFPLLACLKVDPLWDPIRSDPRFERILKRLNLPL